MLVSKNLNHKLFLSVILISLIIFSLLLRTTKAAGDSSSDEKKEIEFLQKINKKSFLDQNFCEKKSENKQGPQQEAQKCCKDYLGVFDIRGNELYQHKIKELIIKISEVDIGRILLDKIEKKQQGKKILVYSGQISMAQDSQISISFGQMESNFILTKSKSKEIQKLDIDKSALLFHELIHIYYKGKRKENQLLKDPYDDDTEELATIEGDTKIFCLSKKDNLCKKKIYKLNENEYRRQAGLLPRYSHQGFIKDELISDASTDKEGSLGLKKYFLGCSTKSHSTMAEIIKDKGFKEQLLKEITSLNANSLKKFKDEFKVSEEFVLDICQYAVNQFRIEKEIHPNGLFFYTLLKDHQDPKTFNKCLDNFKSKEIEILLIENKDHFFLKYTPFLSMIKKDNDLYKKIIRQAHQSGSYNILNTLIKDDKDEENIKIYLDILESTFPPLSRDHFLDDPCVFYNKIKKAYVAKLPLSTSKSKLAENFLFLSSICNDNQILDSILNYSNFDLNQKVDILCEIPKKFLKNKVLSIYENFFSQNIDKIKKHLINEQNVKGSCLWLLEKFSQDKIVYPIESIINNLTTRNLEVKHLRNTISEFNQDDRKYIIKISSEKIKKLFNSINNYPSFPSTEIGNIIRLSLAMEDKLNQSESIFSCELLNAITDEDFSDMDISMTTYPNDIIMLIDFLEKKGMKCPGEDLAKKIHALCSKMDYDNICPYSLNDIITKLR